MSNLKKVKRMVRTLAISTKLPSYLRKNQKLSLMMVMTSATSAISMEPRKLSQRMLSRMLRTILATSVISMEPRKLSQWMLSRMLRTILATSVTSMELRNLRMLRLHNLK